MYKYLTTLLLFISFSSHAQYAVTGKVVDRIDKRPIPLATVFFNKTGISGTTNNNGEFILKNVPAGHYLLLVEIVGYKNFKANVTVNGSTALPVIPIFPSMDTLNEVAVKGEAKISPYYYKFKNDFLGNTIFARQCKILNPWVIKFYDTNIQGDYSAKSADFINIENDALGYKVKLMLSFFTRNHKTGRTDYDGQSFFEEMKGTPQQEHIWQKNRMECYQGSIMQFLRAVLGGTARQQGFVIKKAYMKDNPYYDPIAIWDDDMDDKNLYKIKDTVLHETDIVSRTNKPGLYALTRGGNDTTSCLYVEYRESGHKNSPRVPWIWSSLDSFILFDKPYTIFDYNGLINTQGNIKIMGFLGEGRIANQLPVDYEPGQ